MSESAERQTESVVGIAANLQRVRHQVAQAASRVGRQPDEVTLVAVSKTKPFSAIREAAAAGQLDFGENRLQELWDKVDEAQRLGLSQLRWHMIGSIQSRQTRRAVGPFALVHSVDRLKIARRLSRDAEAANYVLSILLEVNVSGEASKHGFQPDELLALADQLTELPALRIEGLMTMAPFVADPEETRPVFRALRELRNDLRDAVPQIEWTHLSMGMTNDFEVAVEEGATIIRVGSAIFGARDV